DLDMQALADYFTYQAIPDPLSIFQAVKKLPPGHTLTIDIEGGFDIQRYWQWGLVETTPITLPRQEVLERLRCLLEEAVRLRLMSDVPLGALLSGGVDSSA